MTKEEADSEEPVNIGADQPARSKWPAGTEQSTSNEPKKMMKKVTILYKLTVI